MVNLRSERERKKERARERKREGKREIKRVCVREIEGTERERNCVCMYPCEKVRESKRKIERKKRLCTCFLLHLKFNIRGFSDLGPFK